MFMKEPEIDIDSKVYTMNSSIALRTIIGFATLGTVFASIVVNPLIEFITAFVYNSGY